MGIVQAGSSVDATALAHAEHRRPRQVVYSVERHGGERLFVYGRWG